MLYVNATSFYSWPPRQINSLWKQSMLKLVGQQRREVKQLKLMELVNHHLILNLTSEYNELLCAK